MRGKVYVIDPDAAAGIYCQKLFNTATAALAGADLTPEDIASLELDDEAEKNLYPKVLGPAYAEMFADGIPWVWIKHAGTTALMWLGLGMPAAESFWAAAPQGEARRPATQDRKSPAKKSTRPRKSAQPGSRGSSTPSPSVSEIPSTS